MPSWFHHGTSISITDDQWDAGEFLEDDEFDFEWRLCYVPSGILHPTLPDYRPTDPDESEERIRDIEEWAEEHGSLHTALLTRPPIAILRNGEVTILDGHHRTFLSKRVGLETVPMLVGVGGGF